MKISKLVLIICFTFMTHIAYALPTAKVTARFIDDEGVPIVGANVRCHFETPKKGGWGVVGTQNKGITDKNGLFTARGSTNEYGVSCGAKLKGYYRGGAGSGRFTGVTGIVGFRRWQPWNPTIDVVLKKIRNPIPMFVAANTGKAIAYTPPATLPEEGRDFGYDLIANDWVVPNGQGLHSDFVFKIDVGHFRSEPLEYDATMILKFSNPDDGIQSFYTPEMSYSALKFSHNAPLKGYQDKLMTRVTREKNKILDLPYRDDQNYYFRVRTKRDDQGNIIEALYGKIYGNIIFSFPSDGEKGEIYFTYYLNPNNNDTNIEFSPEKNLFPKPQDVREYRFNP